MDLLKERILKDGRVEESDILKVDSFLNHQIDISLFEELGKEFFRLFGDKGITKILTIEASGIGIACFAAQYFKVPVVYGKKTDSRNLEKENYESEVYSYTRQTSYKIRVSMKYLHKDDKLLIIDDFLANGKAALGLLDIVKQSGASLEGIGIVIEKTFQPGGQLLRSQGIRVESLAKIKEIGKGSIIFE